MTSKEAFKRIKQCCESACLGLGQSPYNRFLQSITPCREDLKVLQQSLNRLEKLEKAIELCLTKYVPLDSLSPSFWESKKAWLSNINYKYYLFLCEECEYVVKENRKLTLDEFNLVYKLLKEVLENE